jgi:hypothetical protein
MAIEQSEYTQMEDLRASELLMSLIPMVLFTSSATKPVIALITPL